MCTLPNNFRIPEPIWSLCPGNLNGYKIYIYYYKSTLSVLSPMFY
jgi:hypothetical protein